MWREGGYQAGFGPRASNLRFDITLLSSWKMESCVPIRCPQTVKTKEDERLPSSDENKHSVRCIQLSIGAAHFGTLSSIHMLRATG